MKKVFTVCTVSIETPEPAMDGFFSTRTVGWYSSKKDAEDCVLNNYGDIYEDGCYQYATIEEVHEGLYPFVEHSWWFKWDKEKGGYQPIDKPEAYCHMSNFSIG